MDSKEKQIEEIMRCLNECCNEYDSNGRHIRNLCNSLDCEYWCDTNHCCCSYNKKEAIALYNAGYQNCKDKVVLSKEEYEKLERSNYQEGIAEGRKELQDEYNSLRERYAKVVKENTDLDNTCGALLDRNFRLSVENERLYEMKLDLEHHLIQSGLTEYIGADEIEKQARKEMARELICFIEQLKIKEDGRHEWRDHHNDAIDKVIFAINKHYINNIEAEE